MTETIVRLFNLHRKRSEIDAVTADRLELMTWRVRQLGDAERDMLRWRDSFRLRTGRAA